MRLEPGRVPSRRRKTAPSLLSPTKRTPSGLKVRAPADCGMTSLLMFMMVSIDRPLMAEVRLSKKRLRLMGIIATKKGALLKSSVEILGLLHDGTSDCLQCRHHCLRLHTSGHVIRIDVGKPNDPRGVDHIRRGYRELVGPFSIAEF